MLSIPALAEDEEKEKKVYRTTDEHGRPVFSDTASDDAKEVEVKTPMTFPAGRFANQYNRVTAPGNAGGEGDEAAFAYKKLAITSPTPDEAIRSNAGTLTVSFVVDPSPRQGHTVQLMMDGKVLQKVRGSEPIALENVDRGTHQVQLQVTDDESGTVLQQGTPVTFSLLRHSILNNRTN
jgi:hypothetical protein